MQGFFKKKGMLTRVLVVFMVFVMVLPLIGCLDSRSGLQEGFIKSMDINSYRSSSTLSVTNNIPAEEMNEQAQAVFSLLEKGVVMEALMENTTSMKLTLTPEDAASFKLLGWDYPQAPSLEFCVDGGKIALKTSADPRYLVLDTADAGLAAPGADVDFSAVFGADYMQGQTEKAYALVEALIKDCDFPLSQVESLGTETLSFPDGSLKARKIRINLDFKEILDLVTYTAEYLAESEAFKDYIQASMREPLERMVETGALPPEELPTAEEMDEFVETAYQEMQSSLSGVLEYLHAASPAMLKKYFGLDLSATVDYYLDNEGFIRKTNNTYRLKAEHEILESIFGTPRLDLTINSEQILWDINKPVQVAFPAASEQVSFFALMADPALQEEIGDGPLSQLIKMLQSPGGEFMPAASLVLDLDKGIYLLNGQVIDLAPPPYMEGAVPMVPFRALAELAGGEILWIPETKLACYKDERVEMQFSVGGAGAFINGEETALDAAVVNRDGRLMVPAWLAGKLAQHLVVQENSVIFVF